MIYSQNNQQFKINKIEYIHGLKIASINVHGLISDQNSKDTTKIRLLQQWIYKHEFDIICIQEICVHHNHKQSKFPIALFKEDYCVYDPCSEVAILWKRNLAFEIPKIDIIKNECQWSAWIRIISNKSVLNICSFYHSPSKQAINHIDDLNHQIGQLRNQAKGYKHYFLIMGDFNAQHDLWSTKTNYRGNNVYDWTIDNNFTICNDGKATYIAPNGNESALDLTIVSNNASNLINSWTVDSWLHKKTKQFDHYGIFLKFNFSAITSKGTTHITFNFKEFESNNQAQEDYNDELYNNLSIWNNFLLSNYIDIDKLDIITDYFQKSIIDAAIKHVGLKFYNSHSKPGKSCKLMKLIETRVHFRKKLHKSMKNSKYSEIKKHINYLTHKIRKIQRKQLKKYQDNIKVQIEEAAVGDSKLFYKLYYKATNQTQSPIPTLHDKNGNIIAVTSQEKAKVLHKHFNRKVAENDYTNNNISHHLNISNQVHSYKRNNNQSESILNRNFTEQEVMRCIITANKNTAMGFDKIHQKLIYYGRHTISPFLCKLWNYIYVKHATSPTIWKYANISPIPKPGRDNSIVKNNRPISLIPVLARLIEKALAFRLLTYLITNNLIKHWNCAFQPNKSTEDILIALADNIQRSFEQESLSEISFKDLQSAYDSVWHEGLYYKIKNYFNIDGNFLNFLQTYLSNRCNRVILDDTITEWAKHDLGLPQGGPMMPILWTMYINDFNIVHKNIKLLAFADDMSMYTISNKLDINNSIALQNEINRFYEWTLNWKLVINAEKCSSLTLTHRKNLQARVYNINNINMSCVHHPNNAPYICTHNHNYQYVNAMSDDSINDQNAPKTPTTEELLIPSKWRMRVSDPHKIPLHVRILGLLFDPKLSWNEHITSIVKRCNQKLYQLSRIAYCPDYNLSPKNVWKLYTSTIRPIIEYGLCVYSTSSTFTKLEQIQNRAMRIALRLRKTTPIYTMRKILGCESIAQRLSRMRINLWCKLVRSPSNTLSHETYLNWYNFVQNQINNQNISSRIKNINNFSTNFLNKYRKSPISTTYEYIQSIHPPNIPTTFFYHQQHYKAPPCYLHPFPSKLNTYKSIDEMDENNQFLTNETMECWTDGSCIPNPGPGGGAAIFPSKKSLNTTRPINHPTTINYAELVAIEAGLISFNNFIYNNNNQYKQLSIFTDSKFCWKLFNLEGYPKINYYYGIMNNIIKLINKINANNISISIIKVPAHQDIENNELVDKLAKQAAKTAVNWSDNNYHPWDSLETPATVDISILKEFYKDNNITEEINYLNDKRIAKLDRYIYEEWNEFHDEQIFIEAQFNPRYKDKWFNNYKYFKEELEFLSSHQLEIINKLRSEHCNLNNYKAYFFKETNGFCNNCKVWENVTHFLTECETFETERYELWVDLGNIENIYKNLMFFTPINILFPQHIQDKPTRDNPNRKEILREQRNKRLKILRRIVKYVDKTNRFDSEYGI